MQDSTHRRLLINKLYHSIGRIAAGEKVPSLEKRIARLRDQKTRSAIFFSTFHTARRGRCGHHIGNYSRRTALT
jgi:hypothetical protein